MESGAGGGGCSSPPLAGWPSPRTWTGPDLFEQNGLGVLAATIGKCYFCREQTRLKRVDCVPHGQTEISLRHKVLPNLNVCLGEAAFFGLECPVNNGITKGLKSPSLN